MQRIEAQSLNQIIRGLPKLTLLDLQHTSVTKIVRQEINETLARRKEALKSNGSTALEAKAREPGRPTTADTATFVISAPASGSAAEPLTSYSEHVKKDKTHLTSLGNP